MRREQLTELVRSLFADFLEDRFYRYNKKVRETLATQAFADLNSQPKAKEINLYFSDLMAENARAVYERMKPSVLSDSVKELDEILGQLFGDEEVQQVLEFVASPVGRKIARNLDILREAFGKHVTSLNMEILKAWNDPAVAKQLDDYVRKITGEEQ